VKPWRKNEQESSKVCDSSLTVPEPSAREKPARRLETSSSHPGIGRLDPETSRLRSRSRRSIKGARDVFRGGSGGEEDLVPQGGRRAIPSGNVISKKPASLATSPEVHAGKPTGSLRRVTYRRITETLDGLYRNHPEIPPSDGYIPGSNGNVSLWNAALQEVVTASADVTTWEGEIAGKKEGGRAGHVPPRQIE
jgi:hypothetical protein